MCTVLHLTRVCASARINKSNTPFHDRLYSQFFTHIFDWENRWGGGELDEIRTRSFLRDCIWLINTEKEIFLCHIRCTKIDIICSFRIHLNIPEYATLKKKKFVWAKYRPRQRIFFSIFLLGRASSIYDHD